MTTAVDGDPPFSLLLRLLGRRQGFVLLYTFEST